MAGKPDDRVARRDAFGSGTSVDVDDRRRSCRPDRNGRARTGPASRRSPRRAARMSWARHARCTPPTICAGDVRIELADGQIVEKEERRRVDDEDVVDAVVDEIARRRCRSVWRARDQHLRADAVGRGDERASRIAGQREEPAETADAAELARMAPRAGHLAIALDGGVAGGDVDAGARVRVGRRVGSASPRRTRSKPDRFIAQRSALRPTERFTMQIRIVDGSPRRRWKPQPSSFPSSPTPAWTAPRRTVDRRAGRRDRRVLPPARSPARPTR